MFFILRFFRKRWNKPTASVYTTTVLEVQPDKSWTAELSKDGVPYARMQVHSISHLLARFS